MSQLGMQWPPTQGGKIYWFLRKKIFQLRRTECRIIRMVRENMDNQLDRGMEPKRSYDPRVNQWLLTSYSGSHSGFVGRVGSKIGEDSLRPVLMMMALVYGLHTLWLQEKTAFQMYIKWRGPHADERRAKREAAEAAAAEEAEMD